MTVPQSVCHAWPLSRDCGIASGGFKLGKREVERNDGKQLGGEIVENKREGMCVQGKYLRGLK